jgi:hypothetical protein
MDSLQTTLINSDNSNNNTKKKDKRFVCSCSWFPNSRSTCFPATIPFIPLLLSPSHSLLVSGEDFQQSFRTEMSEAGKEADDYCS